jgi:hypothetical protein
MWINLILRGANHLINEVSDKTRQFERKLRLWEIQLWLNNMMHSPILRKKQSTDAMKYPEVIQLL